MNHFSCLETGYKDTKTLDEFTLFSSSSAKTGHILKTPQFSSAQRKQLLYVNSCPNLMQGVHHSPVSCQDCTSIQLLSIWRNYLSCKYFLPSIKSFILKKCVHSEGCCLFPQSSLFTAVTHKIFTSLQLLMYTSSYSAPLSSFGICTSSAFHESVFPKLLPWPLPQHQVNHKVGKVEEEYSKLLKTKPQLQRRFHTQYLYTLLYYALSK